MCRYNLSHVTDEGSLVTDAVRPAAELPLPEVYTAMGATLSTNFSNCDLAVPGSPNSKMLMSPRLVRPSGNFFLEPILQNSNSSVLSLKFH